MVSDSMRLERALGAVLAAALLAWMMPGWLDAARADTTVMTDGRDPGRGPDIESVSAGHTKSGRLRYRISTYEPFAKPNSPCVNILAGLDLVRYRVCGNGAVVHLASGNRTGRAAVNRPSHRTIIYTFNPSAIGSATFHRWRAVDLGHHCRRGVCDASPDGGYVSHHRRVSYDAWAKAFLREMHAPRCTDNRIVVVAWELNEGTDAVWNPLATTYRMPGATNHNSVGVKNYASLAQGLNATRLTIERGFSMYGYGEIVRRLQRCALPMKTARAIKQSSWCGGCSDGHYVTGLIRTVKGDFPTYGGRLISTAL